MIASSGFLLLSCVCLVSVVRLTRGDVCTEPPDPVNGDKRQHQGNNFGDYTVFRCFENATMVGDSTTICQRNGRWSREFPTCVLNCPPLAAPENGFFRGPDGARVNEYHTRYAIGCNDGYKLKGAEPGEEIVPECMDNSKWKYAECEVAFCPALQPIPHATLEHFWGEERQYHSLYKYTCQFGYKFSGADSDKYLVYLRCLANQTWHRTVPDCEALPCPRLDAPRNGFVRDLAGAHGMSYAIGCNQGYKLKDKEPGEEIMTECLDNSTWSWHQHAECQDRKIFRSRQEWADFFTNNRLKCCTPWSKYGYQWKTSCSLDEWIKEECMWDAWSSGQHLVEVCNYEEVREYNGDEHIKRQVWYAMLGVKVGHYGNQCCWTKNGQDYPCYESYTGAR